MKSSVSNKKRLIIPMIISPVVFTYVWILSILQAGTMTAPSETTESSVQLYPVRIRNCGSTYSRRLRDVDGFYLVNDNGKLLNVYTKEMKDAFESGALRAIHNVRDGYVYFVQHDEQIRRFKREREEGSDLVNIDYFVYYDPA